MLTDGFRQLGRTMRGLKAYPLTLFFLLAFLVYNDGIQTVIALASQYGTEELRARADHADHHDPDGAVPGVRRRAAARRGSPKRIGAWKTVLLSLVLWTGVIVAAFLLPAEAAGAVHAPRRRASASCSAAARR